MKKLIYFIIFLLLLQTGMAATYTYNFPENNVELVSYTCATSNCQRTELQEYNRIGPTNPIFINYQDSTDYIELFLHECYLTKTQKVYVFPSIDVQSDITLNKKAQCSSDININYEGELIINQPITIIVTAKSPIKNSDFPPYHFIPTGAENYYQTNIEIELEGISTKTTKVNFESEKEILFTYTPTVTGNLRLTINSNVNDCKCQSSQTITKTLDLTIQEATPEIPAVTPPPKPNNILEIVQQNNNLSSSTNESTINESTILEETPTNESVTGIITNTQKEDKLNGKSVIKPLSEVEKNKINFKNEKIQEPININLITTIIILTAIILITGFLILKIKNKD